VPQFLVHIPSTCAFDHWQREKNRPLFFGSRYVTSKFVVPLPQKTHKYPPARVRPLSLHSLSPQTPTPTLLYSICVMKMSPPSLSTTARECARPVSPVTVRIRCSVQQLAQHPGLEPQNVSPCALDCAPLVACPHAPITAHATAFYCDMHGRRDTAWYKTAWSPGRRHGPCVLERLTCDIPPCAADLPLTYMAGCSCLSVQHPTHPVPARQLTHRNNCSYKHSYSQQSLQTPRAPCSRPSSDARATRV
jgi:hypothetical protein